MKVAARAGPTPRPRSCCAPIQEPTMRRTTRTTYRPAFEQLESRLVPATLLTNFSETAVATGLTSATAMEFSPDAKLFVAEQAGTMEVWQGTTHLQANFFAN